MTVPYSTLPYYNELFIDYIENFGNVSKFFKFDYTNYHDFIMCIEDKKKTYLKNSEFSRNDLCDILKEHNNNFNSSEETLENIQLLHYDNTFAVVTGQQLGFLSGPLYTIYKAINTVQLCGVLAKKFTEYNFVPVFWMEADDHDFLEINNVSVLNKENEVKTITYFEKGIQEEKYLKPSGEISLDEHIKNFISELKEQLQDSDFSPELFEKIESAYKPGNNTKDAFGKFFNSLLGELGIILVDPSDSEIKKLLKPVFIKELYSFPQNCEKVINTSVEIEKNYPAQVKPQPINLFYIHNGNRYLLEPREGEIFALKNSRQKFTKDELYSILDLHPERFSWNVVTRPVAQDYLLPTISYIGGPSEIAYFAQLSDVYDSYEITMPVIYPRTSVTLMERKVKNFLEKYDIVFNSLFEKDELKRSLLKKMEEVNAEGIFSDMKDELNAVFYRYEKELEKIDKNLINTYKKKNDQYLDSLSVIKEKFSEAQIRQSEIINNQLDKIISNIAPEDSFQERILNVSYYLNKYSFQLIEFLYKHLDVENFSHQILSLDFQPKKKEEKPAVKDEREGSLFQGI